MYKIVITKRAIKDLERIDTDSRKRIGEKLSALVDDPFTSTIKLTNPIVGTYRFRIGEYRIVFDIVKNEIVILRIGHRKDIYK